MAFLPLPIHAHDLIPVLDAAVTGLPGPEETLA